MEQPVNQPPVRFPRLATSLQTTEISSSAVSMALLSPMESPPQAPHLNLLEFPPPELATHSLRARLCWGEMERASCSGLLGLTNESKNYGDSLFPFQACRETFQALLLTDGSAETRLVPGISLIPPSPRLLIPDPARASLESIWLSQLQAVCLTELGRTAGVPGGYLQVILKNSHSTTVPVLGHSMT